ncbi:uncharacterized protein LOC143028838 [Oratosquilla oratoria]|uniref:uncharacterized protein LOC143028838 n=1 Tax=Oratosquilla oratoria TaxID=337810 RepID=UPI003F767A7A
MARLLKITSVIVWDEVVMANKNTITALDITLRDILGENRFMGGIVFVSAGDFRQILPVVRGGGKNDELKCCIKSSYFWDDLVKLELTENVRLDVSYVENKTFAKSLLEFGTGESGYMHSPQNFGVVVETHEELVEKVYDKLEENHLNVSYFEKWAIVSPTNDDVDRINYIVYDKSDKPEMVYMSEDISVEDDMDIQQSVYNAMTSPSLPLHELRLKIDSIIMVIRNICPPKLCNGTRVMVTNLEKNIIVGKILGGTYRGEQVLLPRVTLEPTDTREHQKETISCETKLRYDNKQVPGTFRGEVDVLEATPASDSEDLPIAEEEPEHGTSVIPKSIFSISEQEAFAMIMPSFSDDEISDKKDLEELLDLKFKEKF